MTSHNQKRKKVLIDPSFQLRFVWRLGVVLLANFALFFTLSVMAPAAFGFLMGSPSWGAFEALLRTNALWYTVLLPLAGTLLCLYAQGVRETFKIAAPSAKMRRALDEVASLKFPRDVKIRKDDYMLDTVKSLNGALGAVRGKLLELQHLSIVSEASLQDASSIDRVRGNLKQMNELLDQFDFGQDAEPAEATHADTVPVDSAQADTVQSESAPQTDQAVSVDTAGETTQANS